MCGYQCPSPLITTIIYNNIITELTDKFRGQMYIHYSAPPSSEFNVALIVASISTTSATSDVHFHGYFQKVKHF